MKKRSLVAALAMLVVSAIVLTSSTYAWFATSSAAAVDKFSATVTNNSGSLTVQAVNGNTLGTKKTTIVESDFTAIGATLAKTLQPVSLYLDGGVNVNKVAYDAAKFDTFTAATKNLEYLFYEFNVEYLNGGKAAANVQMTPTFTAEDDFLYGLLEVTFDGTTTYYYFDTVSGSYVPVKGLDNGLTNSESGAKYVEDTNSNNIIDSADKGYSAADMAANVADASEPGVSGEAINLFSAPAGVTSTANVKVYVWAEGQDPQCSGIVNSAAAGFSFSLGLGA